MGKKRKEKKKKGWRTYLSWFKMRIGYYGFFSDGGYNGGACSRRWFLSYSAYSLSTYRFSLFFLEVICFPFFFPFLVLPLCNFLVETILIYEKITLIFFFLSWFLLFLIIYFSFSFFLIYPFLLSKSNYLHFS